MAPEGIVEGADAPADAPQYGPDKSTEADISNHMHTTAAPVPLSGGVAEYEPSVPHLGAAFTYQAPDEGQKVVYELVRQGALNFARIIERYVPHCADRTAAIRKIREAVMTANAAVALKGRI